jgi:hypothetical protein
MVYHARVSLAVPLVYNLLLTIRGKDKYLKGGHK